MPLIRWSSSFKTTDAVYPGHSLGHRNLPKFIESARVIHVTRSGDYSILKQKPPKEEKRNVYKWVLIALDTLTGAGITSCQHIYRTVDSGSKCCEKSISSYSVFITKTLLGLTRIYKASISSLYSASVSLLNNESFPERRNGLAPI